MDKIKVENNELKVTNEDGTNVFRIRPIRQLFNQPVIAKEQVTAEDVDAFRGDGKQNVCSQTRVIRVI